MGLLAMSLVSRACYFVPLPPLRFQTKSSSRRVLNAALPSSEKMRSGGRGAAESKLMEFPHLTAAHRDLMVDLIQGVENGVGEHLLPSTVPPDVEYYENQSGTSQGTLLIRSALQSSPVTFSSLKLVFSFTKVWGSKLENSMSINSPKVFFFLFIFL